MAVMPFVSVEHVRFGYGEAPVLDGVSLDVPADGLVGILGPNGSGKTTLLRLMAGSLKAQAGRVRVDGSDAESIARGTLARRLAVVPQETHLAFDYTVLEIALMGRYPHLRAFDIEGPRDLASAHAALAATGTDHLAERPFRTLSGGEKQRVVIASALAQVDAPADGPALLLLDEPTASLDLRHQIGLAALLRRLHAERALAIVLTTHDLRFARAVCSEIVLLAHGRVLAAGAPSDVLTPERIAEAYEIDAELAAPLLR
jgi:iron complex transport system ATP-binding protein